MEKSSTAIDTTRESSQQPHDAEVKPFPGRSEPEATPAAAPSPTPQPAPAEAGKAKSGGGRKRLLLGAVAVVVLGLAGHYGYDYWTVGRFMVSTDDAYLTADMTSVAPKVLGYVQTVAVKDNQRVKAGDLLLRLDDGDYQNALKTAQNAVALQKDTIARIGTQIDAARAAVTQAEAAKTSDEAALRNAQLKFDRTQRLAKSSFAAQSDLDDATSALDQAKAAITGADAAILSAQANVSVLKAQQTEAETQMGSLDVAVKQAELNLSRTVLRAPVDGVVGNVSARKGDLIAAGQKIAAIVPVDGIYVEANYKETQLPGIAPGATAHVTIDAMPGKDFVGTVASMAPATGSQFSLLPAENATGNFTKVVQRVPVRIHLPEKLLESGKLRAGLSAVVDIDSRTSDAGN